MSNAKNNTPTLQDQIKALKAALTAANLPAEMIETNVQALIATQTGAARDAIKGQLMEAAQAVAKGADATLMCGATFAVEIAFSDKGKATVTYLSRSKGKGGSKGGKRPVLIANGIAFRSFAKMCEAAKIDPNGASGRVVYEAAVKAGTAPAFVEIPADVWEANEADLRKQHKVTRDYSA